MLQVLSFFAGEHNNKAGFVYIRSLVRHFPCHHMFFGGGGATIGLMKKKKKKKISSRMRWSSESALRLFLSPFFQTRDKKKAHSGFFFIRPLFSEHKKIRDNKFTLMGFLWKNNSFSFWFILVLETCIRATSSLECFECSDFPREDYSEDEEQGTCPGWLRPPRCEQAFFVFK